jgi:hypothetical protein
LLSDFTTVPSGGWDVPLVETTSSSSDVVSLFSAEQSLTLLAVLGIEDPLRPSVKLATQKCYTAGVDVRMCTGGALETAVAISLQCGILRQQDMEIREDGRAYPKPYFAMTDAEFDERIHYRDHDKPLVWRRTFDFKTGNFGEMRAPPFKVDAKGEKIVNTAKFDQSYEYWLDVYLKRSLV